MSRADAADDPGLAAERTALAWTRSALSLAAIGALTVRAASQAHLAIVGYPVGGLLLVAAVALWAYGSGAYRRVRHRGGADAALPATRMLRAIALSTFAVALFALVFAFVIVVE